MIGALRTARVAGAHARVVAIGELQYRANAATYLVNTVLTLGLSLGSLALVYGKVDDLGGWSRDELLVVVGVFFALGAVVNGVVHVSMSHLVAQIRLGDFDFRLLKPIDAQALALVQRIDPWRLLDLPVGMALIVIALARTSGGDGSELTTRIGVAAVMFAASCLVVVGFWTLLSSITFWTVQGEGMLWALDDMYDHLRWPIGIFPDGLRIALATVFPAGIAVTVPAEALTGRLDATGALILMTIAATLLGASRIIWRVAVRRYEGASS